MSDRFFLDTNILVYSFDPQSPKKRMISQDLIYRALEGEGIISFQVVQEFLNFSFRQVSRDSEYKKLQSYFLKVLQPLCRIHSSNMLYGIALQIRQQVKCSWYDALIIASAQEADCRVLYSEDLQNNRKLNELVIKNPFLN